MPLSLKNLLLKHIFFTTGVLLAASLTSISRMLEAENLPCSSVKVANEINMRQFCQNMPKVGCLSSAYESEYQSQDVTSRSEFWKRAHELTVKHSQAKDLCSQKPQKIATTKYALQY